MICLRLDGLSFIPLSFEFSFSGIFEISQWVKMIEEVSFQFWRQNSKDGNKDYGNQKGDFRRQNSRNINKDSGTKIRNCDFWRENSKYILKEFVTKIKKCDFWHENSLLFRS